MWCDHNKPFVFKYENFFQRPKEFWDTPGQTVTLKPKQLNFGPDTEVHVEITPIGRCSAYFSLVAKGEDVDNLSYSLWIRKNNGKTRHQTHDTFKMGKRIVMSPNPPDNSNEHHYAIVVCQVFSRRCYVCEPIFNNRYLGKLLDDLKQQNIELISKVDRLQRERTQDRKEITLLAEKVEAITSSSQVPTQIIECVVCSGRADKCAVPCGHLMCGSCYDQIEEMVTNCPLCRAEIDKIQRIYY